MANQARRSPRPSGAPGIGRAAGDQHRQEDAKAGRSGEGYAKSKDSAKSDMGAQLITPQRRSTRLKPAAVLFIDGLAATRDHHVAKFPYSRIILHAFRSLEEVIEHRRSIDIGEGSNPWRPRAITLPLRKESDSMGFETCSRSETAAAILASSAAAPRPGFDTRST